MLGCFYRRFNTNQTVPRSLRALTPTHHNINNKFSVKYFLNLVLVDEEDRRYFKQQEIPMYRLHETSWTNIIQMSIKFVDHSNKEDWWTLKNSQIQELVSKSCFSWGNMVWHSNICLKFNSCNDVHWLICYSILKEVFLICAGSFLWMGMCCRWLNVYCDIFNTLVFCYLQCTTSWNNHVLFSIILNKQNLLTLICYVCLYIDTLFFSFW
jgi:hypothetical protein